MEFQIHLNWKRIELNVATIFNKKINKQFRNEVIHEHRMHGESRY